ncbi:MAG: hypothetical protein VW405_02915 [Rhodospirillaceae bacterium]
MPLGFSADAQRVLAAGSAVARSRVRIQFHGRANDQDGDPVPVWDHYFYPNDDIVAANPVRRSAPSEFGGALESDIWNVTVRGILPDANPSSPLYDQNARGSYGGFIGTSPVTVQFGVRTSHNPAPDGSWEWVDAWSGYVDDVLWPEDGTMAITCADKTKTIRRTELGDAVSLAGTALDFTSETNAIAMAEALLTNTTYGVGLAAADLDAPAWTAAKATMSLHAWNLKGGGAAWDGTNALSVLADIGRHSFSYFYPNGSGAITVRTLLPRFLDRPRMLRDSDSLSHVTHERRGTRVRTRVVVTGTNVTTTTATSTWNARPDLRADDPVTANLLTNDTDASKYALWRLARQEEPRLESPASLGPADVDVDIFDTVRIASRTLGTATVDEIVFEREWDIFNLSGAIRPVEDAWAQSQWFIVGVDTTRGQQRIF